jgi:hypothetical protein
MTSASTGAEQGNEDAQNRDPEKAVGNENDGVTGEGWQFVHRAPPISAKMVRAIFTTRMTGSSVPKQKSAKPLIGVSPGGSRAKREYRQQWRYWW